MDRQVNGKLEDRIREMIHELESAPFNIVMNRELDKFYYMEKLEEMKMLDIKLREAIDRVELMMAARYDLRRAIVLRWKKDVRWLASWRKQAEVKL